PIDSGQILIDDEDVTRKPVWARANRVARVFQDPMAGTCEDLTIEENMALAQRRGAGRGLGRAVQASMRDGFRESLATLGLGLENRLGDRIGLLSGCSAAISRLTAWRWPPESRPMRSPRRFSRPRPRVARLSRKPSRIDACTALPRPRPAPRRCARAMFSSMVRSSQVPAMGS
ncbi:hypothetical protein ACV330_29440, partial [Pseudomonas aeruginosa]